MDPDFLAELWEETHDAIILRGPQDIIVFWSRGAERLYGWSREEARGRPAQELLQTKFPEALERIKESLALNGFWRGELTHTSRSGNPIVVESQWVMQGVDRSEQVLEINRDITERASFAPSQLAAIVGASDDAIISQTLTGTIVSWNCGAERTYGYPASEVIGLSIAVLAPEGFPDVMPNVLQRIEHGEHLEHYETVHVTKEGLPIDVSITVSAVNDPAGRVIGAATIARDITQRRTVERALHEAEEKYRTIFENARESIFYATADGETVRANPALLRLLGYDSDEQFMSDPGHLLGSWNSTQREELWSQLEGEGGGRDFEMEGRRRDGTKIWVSGTMVVVRDAGGKALTYQGTMVDITEHKRSEKTLRDEIDESERASRAKTEFLARMSHELRTPLTAILGFGQLLELGRLTPLQQTESVENILKAGRHLLKLINESVDIAGIEQGRMVLSLEPVRAGDVIGEALDLIGPAAKLRGISIGATPDLDGYYVMADRQRLVQVFLNLLSNAVKYNNDHGSVLVSASKSADNLIVRVADTGPGIAPEVRDRIFTPFERLGAEKSGVQGTGLGLALSLQLVERMGGTIVLQSAVRKGSSFFVTLPVADPPSVPLACDRDIGTRSHAEGPRATSTVLYIEDNLTNLEVMELVLGYRPGVRLISAMQGRLGFDLAKEHQPDLVLLDLNLADMPGREVLTRLKADHATADIPVVILSAEAPHGGMEAILQAGARAYMMKPFDVQVLLELLEEVLGEAAP